MRIYDLKSYLNAVFVHESYSLSPSQQITCSNVVGTSSVSTSLSNLSACGSSKNHESPNASKWTCSVCTFVNSVKNSRCAQCTIKREPESDPSSHVQEQINALSIKDVDAELTAAINNRTSPLRSNSLSGSRGNLGAAGNRISPVDNKCYSATKWPCSVCIRNCNMYNKHSLFFFIYLCCIKLVSD